MIFSWFKKTFIYTSLIMLFCLKIYSIDLKTLREKQTFTVSQNITYALVTSFLSGKVTSCVINGDGTFSNCIDTANGNNAISDKYISSIDFDDYNNAYLSTYTMKGFPDFSYAICPINYSGLLTCNLHEDINVNVWGNNIAFYKGYAFLSSLGTNTISVCGRDINGTLVGCHNTISLTKPWRITIHNNYAYITGLNDKITLCTINNGFFSNCSYTGNGFNVPIRIVFNKNNAYIGNENSNSVSKCDVNSDGSLTNCGTTAFGFSGVTDLAIFNNFAYILNISINSVSKCKIQDDGSLLNCELTGYNFSNPRSIAIHTP